MAKDLVNCRVICHVVSTLNIGTPKAPDKGLFEVYVRFYSPVNPIGSCEAWSVYLTTHLLGRLSPLNG